MDEVRCESVDRLEDLSKWRAGKMEFPIKRQRERRDKDHVPVLGRRAIIGVNDLNLIPRGGQEADELSERPGNTVNLGKVGFRD